MDSVSYTLMAYEFGWVLRDAREQADFTQAEVAEHLSVSQQTVSRWESGRSRPREEKVTRLAELLGVADTRAFLQSAGYDQIEMGPIGPVRPLLTDLPLGNLTPQDFESFCRDFVKARHPEAEVHRFGGPGHKQDGIDLRAELRDGQRIAYQCKRMAQFGPARLRAAVDSTSVEADQYVLLLSRSASPELRKAADTYPKWSIQDVEDISASVRFELSPEAAKRLVETYFPGWRRDFLGNIDPGPWLTPGEFFRPSMKPNPAISHQWNLVGRSEELAAIDRFLHSDQQSIVVSGRGGMGKTRLLREVSDRVIRDPQTPALVFLAPEVRFEPDHIELLPRGEPIVVVDDAHDRDDVGVLLAALGRSSRDGRVILATRPYGEDRLLGELYSQGMLAVDEDAVIRVQDLDLDDIEKLASEVLGHPADTHPESARLVAAATRDCPLFTVVAARLVASKQVDPRELATDQTVRTLLIRHFKDVMVGGLGGPADQAALSEVLRFVALVQPVMSNNESFLRLAQEVLQQRQDRVRRHLRTLEEAGVLMRRGRFLRVVPDLLGDFLVADASVDSVTGAPTGYADLVFSAASTDLAQNIIRNVAKLDWRIGRERQSDSAVLDRIWESLTESLLSAGPMQRSSTIRELAGISYYQPRRAIDLARRLISNPTDEADRKGSRWLPTHDDVLGALPEFLRGAAFNMEHLGEVADILWALGRDRKGALNAEPGHAIRVLQEIASITPDKPVEFLRSIINRAIAWTKDPDLTSYEHSPLDVLEAIVVTEGYDTHTRGWALNLTPFAVRVDAVRELRRQAIDAAVPLLAHRDPRVGTRAAEFMETALRYPIGMLGRQPTEEEQDSWSPEFIDTLQRLESFLEGNAVDPVVGQRLKTAISWHISRGGQTAAAARSVDRLLGNGFLVRLTQVLSHGWLDPDQLPGDRNLEYTEMEAKWRATQRQVAQDLRATEPEPANAVDMIEERMNVLSGWTGPSHPAPGPFLAILSQEWIEIAEEILRRVRTGEGPLLPYASILLAEYRNHRRERVGPWLRDFVESGSNELAIQVAVGLTGIARSESLSDEELQLLEELAAHQNPAVRSSIARGLRFASGLGQARRLSLIIGISLDGDASVAAEVVSNFGPRGDFDVYQLPSSDFARLLEDLVRVTEIANYDIGGFLSEASRRDPLRVLSLYTARVAHAEKHPDDHSYRALPYHFEPVPTMCFRESGHFADSIHGVCEWLLEPHDGWHRPFWAPQLFLLVASTIDDEVLEILKDWAGSSDPRRLEVISHLLREAPRELVLTRVDWVTELLELAYALGADCYEKVSSSLHAAVVSGTKSGTPGKPFPEDIEQRDRSARIAKGLPSGTPAQRFYASLARSAEASIRWTQQRHEEDRPDW